MVPSKDLFFLIRSLDKSEKRYFRLFASRQAGEKNYLKLFDAIGLQEEYDEAKIIKEFKHENFTKRFALTKSYLYGLILKSLKPYHENRSVSFEIRSSLNSAQILFSKGLFDQAMKIVVSVKKVIIKYERIDFKPEVLALQKAILFALGVTKYTIEEINKIQEELKKDVAKLVTVGDYELLTAKIFHACYQQGVIRNRKQMQWIEKIMDHPLLKDESSATTLNCKQSFYATHGTYHTMTGNLTKRHLYTTKDLGLYRQYPNIVRDNPRGFLSAMHNYIASCVSLKKYNEAKKSIVELKRLSTTPEFAKDMLLKSRIFYYAINMEMEIFLKQGQFTEGITHVPDFESGLKQLGKRIAFGSGLIASYNIACLFFGARKYEEAKQWINKVLNVPPLDSKKDVYSVARILNLLIHYELEDFDLLEYTLKSTYQLLGRHDKLFRSEKLTLDFIRKFLNKHPDKRTLKNMFQDMVHEINAIKNDPYEKALLEYFDLISWVESKIQGRDFEEVVRKKARTRVRKR